MSREIGWLLESDGGYYFGSDPETIHARTKDHTRAIRFARKVDAERCKVWLFGFGVLCGPPALWQPVEHMWGL